MKKENKKEIVEVEATKDDSKIYLILGIALLVIFGIFLHGKQKIKLLIM